MARVIGKYVSAQHSVIPMYSTPVCQQQSERTLHTSSAGALSVLCKQTLNVVRF